MKLTLLEAVKDVLSVLDFDEVNSITDTPEALQVVNELRNSYMFLMSQRDWPHLCRMDKLEGVADLANPTKMRMPENVDKVLWIKYNNKDVHYLEPYSFTTMVKGRIGNTNANAGGFITNLDAVYWTTYDDEFIVFDSYNSAVDNTMQQSKSDIYVVGVPTWQEVDEYVPDMPAKMFPTWIADAKAACHVHLKQTDDVLEARRSKSGRTLMQSERWRTKSAEARFNGRVNYGRK